MIDKLWQILGKCLMHQLQATRLAAWGNQEAGTSGGNLLHVDETRVGMLALLRKASGRAVRPGPPLFRRPLTPCHLALERSVRGCQRLPLFRKLPPLRLVEGVGFRF